MNGELPNKEDARNAIETLVRYIEKIDGPLREGLLDTPKRITADKTIKRGTFNTPTSVFLYTKATFLSTQLPFSCFCKRFLLVNK